jgi:ribosomal protein S18 acetylase RimI-like enzyme
VSRTDGIEIIDVTDATTFALLPPCADPRFDHRSCDYWEDEVHGSKAARAAWWLDAAPAPKPTPRPVPDNPFAPAERTVDDFNPFAPSSDDWGTPDFNPFAPAAEVEVETRHVPRKLRLLDRGRALFGTYAKVLLRDGEPAAFAQFGPLSAYQRAQRIRDLYPRLPSSPLPAVITCIATVSIARGEGLGQRLVAAVVDDLTARGFAAIEAYPDLTLRADEASAATPAFWERCGFEEAAPDDRYPVMRRNLT